MSVCIFLCVYLLVEVRNKLKGISKNAKKKKKVCGGWRGRINYWCSSAWPCMIFKPKTHCSVKRVTYYSWEATTALNEKQIINLISSRWISKSNGHCQSSCSYKQTNAIIPTTAITCTEIILHTVWSSGNAADFTALVLGVYWCCSLLFLLSVWLRQAFEMFSVKLKFI